MVAERLWLWWLPFFSFPDLVFGVVGGGLMVYAHLVVVLGWLVVACIFHVICHFKYLKIFTTKYFTIKIFTCKIFYIETNGALMLISMEKNEFWFEWWNPIRIWICIFWLLVKFWLRSGEMKNKERIKNNTKIFKCSAKKKELMMGVF